MSYDIDLKAPVCDKCGKCGDEPECPDPTYNLTPIFHFALMGEDQPSPGVSNFEEVVLHKPTERPRGLRVLNGKTGRESQSMLALAMERLLNVNNREKLLAFEPENKWGTLDDAMYVMQRLATLAIDYPDNVWRVQ